MLHQSFGLGEQIIIFCAKAGVFRVVLFRPVPVLKVSFFLYIININDATCSADIDDTLAKPAVDCHRIMINILKDYQQLLVVQ